MHNKHTYTNLVFLVVQFSYLSCLNNFKDFCEASKLFFIKWKIFCAI